MIINTRKDLDAAPAAERERFMLQLSGTIHKWRWNDTEWEQYADTSTIERFGFTVDDFPDATVPPMPDKSPDEKEAEAERDRLDSITVTRFQAKAALLDAGLLEDVQAYIDGSADPVVKLAWEEAGFRRGSKMMNQIGGELGLSEAQMDELFLTAQEIEV